MLTCEHLDAFLFVGRQPVIARDPAVVFIDLAEPQLPIVELAGADTDPSQETLGRDFSLIAPLSDEIDDLAAIQLSKDIAKKIEDNMQYPGQIRVTVVRESRAVDYAK